SCTNLSLQLTANQAAVGRRKRSPKLRAQLIDLDRASSAPVTALAADMAAIWGLTSRVLYFAPCYVGSPVEPPRSPPPGLAFVEPFSACKYGGARAGAVQERRAARIWTYIRKPTLGPITNAKPDAGVGQRPLDAHKPVPGSENAEHPKGLTTS